MLLAGIRGHEVSDSLIADLNENSTVLRNLIQRFSTMALRPELRLDITCFYETRKTEVLNAVLPRSVTQLFPKSTQEIVCFPLARLLLANIDSLSIKNLPALMVMSRFHLMLDMP